MVYTEGCMSWDIILPITALFIISCLLLVAAWCLIAPDEQ